MISGTQIAMMQREGEAQERQVYIDCSLAMQHAWVEVIRAKIEALDIPAMQRALRGRA